MHGRKEDGGAVVIVAGERWSVVGIDTCPYHRGLMTDHIDTLKRLFHRLVVADIEALQVIRRRRGRTVSRGEQQIDGEDFVVSRQQGGADVAPDEAGCPCQKDSHAACAWIVEPLITALMVCAFAWATTAPFRLRSQHSSRLICPRYRWSQAKRDSCD